MEMEHEVVSHKSEMSMLRLIWEFALKEKEENAEYRECLVKNGRL